MGKNIGVVSKPYKEAPPSWSVKQCCKLCRAAGKYRDRGNKHEGV